MPSGDTTGAAEVAVTDAADGAAAVQGEVQGGDASGHREGLRGAGVPEGWWRGHWCRGVGAGRSRQYDARREDGRGGHQGRSESTGQRDARPTPGNDRSRRRPGRRETRGYKALLVDGEHVGPPESAVRSSLTVTSHG
ncbi:MAG: hypothetical protein ACREQ5_06200 [Candidatus Dormibacteria bacterium]